jgi:hypothetical protein
VAAGGHVLAVATSRHVLAILTLLARHHVLAGLALAGGGDVLAILALHAVLAGGGTLTIHYILTEYIFFKIMMIYNLR